MSNDAMKVFKVKYRVTHTKEFRVLNKEQISSIFNPDNDIEILSIEEISNEENLS